MATLQIQYDIEEDGRVIAVVDALPGCMVYGADKDEARKKVVALALAVLADLIEHDEWGDDPLLSVRFAEAA